MKNTNLKITPSPFFYSLFIIFFFTLGYDSYAWNGYDFNSKVEIDIGEGNLVREGLTIQFYDSKTDAYHSAVVLLLESAPGGTMLQVQDLDLKMERTFIMEN